MNIQRSRACTFIGVPSMFCACPPSWIMEKCSLLLRITTHRCQVQVAKGVLEPLQDCMCKETVRVLVNVVGRPKHGLDKTWTHILNAPQLWRHDVVKRRSKRCHALFWMRQTSGQNANAPCIWSVPYMYNAYKCTCTIHVWYLSRTRKIVWNVYEWQAEHMCIGCICMQHTPTYVLHDPNAHVKGITETCNCNKSDQYKHTHVIE